MSKRNGIILGMLFLILVVEILIFAPKELGLSPRDDQAQEETTHKAMDDQDRKGAAQVMNGVYSIEAKGDTREWELWADRALGPRNNTDEWTIQNVRVKFYASNGVIYNVTGKTGHVVPVKNDIRIDGDVVTKSSNGYTFKTQSAFYDSGHRRLASPKAVEMTGPGDQNGGPPVLKGGELNADFNSNQIHIGSGVKAHKTVKGEKLATITSTRAEFSGVTNTAAFYGNVIMDMESMRITGPEAHFVYDPQTHALDAIDILGGVRMTDTDKFATAKTVEVSFKEDRAVFDGSPRVVQNGDELTGDQIIFTNAGRKVQVLNAKADVDPQSVQNSNPQLSGKSNSGTGSGSNSGSGSGAPGEK